MSADEERGKYGIYLGSTRLMSKERFRADCNGCPALDEVITERDEIKEKRLELGRELSEKFEDWTKAVELAEKAVAAKDLAERLMRRMAAQAESDTQLIADLRTKEKDYERIRSELESLKKPWVCDGCKELIESRVVASVDFGEGGHEVFQNYLTFTCPAGCSHEVLLEDPDHIASVCLAIEEQTGLAAREGVGGRITWDRHEVRGCSSEAVGEPVRTLAEYSDDITDPLATAHTELDCAILGVDSENAWALTKNEERDLWVSSVEMFMAAMLKWAQGQEKNRVEPDRIPTEPGLHRAHQTEGD